MVYCPNLGHRLVQQGAVPLNTLVILTQQTEDCEQAVTTGLTTKRIVASDDFQQLFHGFFKIVLRHINRAQLVTCLDVIGIISKSALKCFNGRGRPVTRG